MSYVDPHAVLAFQAERWPTMWATGDPRIVAAKLAEEAGEVCGALVKMAEGRRTIDDAYEEIGDLLVVVAGLIATLDPDEARCESVESLLGAGWRKVQQR